MKRSWFIISLLFLGSSSLWAGNEETLTDTHEQRYRARWASLIPTQLVMQNAGNMGLVSGGLGWSYGRGRWETQLLFGYIPPYESSRGKLTNTIKQNFIPWSIALGKTWSIEPLTTSLYLNTVYGSEFWRSQPQRYPDKYYQFLSTKFRFNLAFGQRITKSCFPSHKVGLKSISLFYEVSTCDIYVRSFFIGSDTPLTDLFGLSLGLKFQLI